MTLKAIATRILDLAVTMHRWSALLGGLDAIRREKVARYADQIAATLARAAQAFAVLERSPENKRALSQAAREIGRLTGYVETIVDVLNHHLDGRKLAGVKRRLEQLGLDGPIERIGRNSTGARIDRLTAAEGYFRALADGLRA